ncbi:hypothetical protein CRV24_009259 [Beauveria bassiana]|nr:hypothetical protein CRV24_009259 [Beauveria bassiana]
MKTAAAAAAATVILAAGLVAAEPQHHALPSGTKINCAKPNASYCMGGDIILRCGPDALGEPARCSANVSGYPPAGGVAECWESSRDAGDAACQKNHRRQQQQLCRIVEYWRWQQLYLKQRSSCFFLDWLPHIAELFKCASFHCQRQQQQRLH